MYRKDQPLYKLVHPELKKVSKALHDANAKFQVFHYCWEENDIPEVECASTETS